MICLDTNIVICIGNQTLDESIVGKEPIAFASILRIEALGFRSIRSIEEQRIRDLLATLIEIPLTAAIIERAIRLRQQKRLSLGDAIMAATAMEHDCELWTANMSDFDGIDGLKVANPLVTGSGR
jgi:predicted nucleic acid-binding protein